MVLYAALFIGLFAFPLRGATIESIRALIQSGRTLEALREINALQKQKPDDPDVQLEIGKIFQELGALRAERLEQLAPNSPQAHELVGKSLEAHEKLPEALMQYRLAAQGDPALPGIHFLIGNLYWKQRDFGAAKPELEVELRLNPNHALANLRMGEISLVMDTDTPDTAVSYLRKAVSDPHASLEAHRELGKAWRVAGRYDEALKELQFVAGRQPEDNQVHAQLAALYRAMGNAEAARKEMETQRQILQRQREASLQLHGVQPPR